MVWTATEISSYENLKFKVNTKYRLIHLVESRCSYWRCLTTACAWCLIDVNDRKFFNCWIFLNVHLFRGSFITRTTISRVYWATAQMCFFAFKTQRSDSMILNILSPTNHLRFLCYRHWALKLELFKVLSIFRSSKEIQTETALWNIHSLLASRPDTFGFIPLRIAVFLVWGLKCTCC